MHPSRTASEAESSSVLSRPTESADERRLIKRFRKLSAGDRQTLLTLADFLAQRDAPESLGTPEIIEEPRLMPRPEKETVVGAIKRLSQTYAMLERDALLNETSALMSAHVLQGRGAPEVIDELEALFAHHYSEYRRKHSPEG
ncbi:hypothetical protein G3446_11220 [Thiorhodococcus minor]|uniref:Crp/Fnr family transcriptional regulator n=1 Tax=Thiorhodococcus minor TaxID=57489 RepID=A0A6M0K0K2_9GAMM|nr:hypothetical protein [Thiorhodococcus minor]